MKDLKISSGVRYMLFAVFVFSLMKVFVKTLSHLPVIEIILFRAIISLFISLFFLIRQKVPVFGKNKPLLLGRGITGAIALTLNFYLIQQIPLATVSTLTYLAPVFSTLIGIFLVKERVKHIQWLFFAISFAGILVIQGFDARISTIHLVMGITTSLFMGLAYNFVRRLNTTEHPLVIIFYFPLVLLPIASVWTYYVWIPPAGMDWFYLLMVGLSTQIAQFFMTKAYQQSEISTVSILNYLGIVFSLALGFYFFDETFNLMTYLGMGMVLAGVVLNVVLKTLRN
ncbi:MAG: drug/metabolite transporter (DMT)-like permease [Cyclobacteriaceae bacterium]|jgi:drug/metabolite transporter (DMT)-like permease